MNQESLTRKSLNKDDVTLQNMHQMLNKIIMPKATAEQEMI